MSQIAKVILEPVFDSTVTDTNLEPNFVRVRAPNSAYLYLNNDAQLDTENPCDVVTKLSCSMSRISRLAAYHFHFRNFSYNVNPYNNSGRFAVGGILYSITIPIGSYTPAGRWTAILTQIAAQVAGFTFTVSIDPIFNTIINVTASIPFSAYDGHIVSCGRYFYGLNPTNSGPLALDRLSYSFSIQLANSYTRYIDICSTILTMYMKIPQRAFNAPGSLMFRWMIDDSDFPIGEFVDTLTDSQDAAWINYNPTQNIDNVDIQLRDEFGNLYYIPQSAWASFDMSLVVLCQA